MDYPNPPVSAVNFGHTLVPDPPFFSGAHRWTCSVCGMTAIRNGRVEYGQATSYECVPKAVSI